MGFMSHLSFEFSAGVYEFSENSSLSSLLGFLCLVSFF